MSKKVGITDTTLRDVHQSLLATRMKIEHIKDKITDAAKRAEPGWVQALSR